MTEDEIDPLIHVLRQACRAWKEERQMEPGSPIFRGYRAGAAGVFAGFVYGYGPGGVDGLFRSGKGEGEFVTWRDLTLKSEFPSFISQIFGVLKAQGMTYVDSEVAVLAICWLAASEGSDVERCLHKKDGVAKETMRMTALAQLVTLLAGSIDDPGNAANHLLIAFHSASDAWLACRGAEGFDQLAQVLEEERRRMIFSRVDAVLKFLETAPLAFQRAVGVGAIAEAEDEDIGVGGDSDLHGEVEEVWGFILGFPQGLVREDVVGAVLPRFQTSVPDGEVYGLFMNAMILGNAFKVIDGSVAKDRKLNFLGGHGDLDRAIVSDALKELNHPVKRVKTIGSWICRQKRPDKNGGFEGCERSRNVFPNCACGEFEFDPRRHYRSVFRGLIYDGDGSPLIQEKHWKCPNPSCRNPQRIAKCEAAGCDDPECFHYFRAFRQDHCPLCGAERIAGRGRSATTLYVYRPPLDSERTMENERQHQLLSDYAESVFRPPDWYLVLIEMMEGGLEGQPMEGSGLASRCLQLEKPLNLEKLYCVICATMQRFELADAEHVPTKKEVSQRILKDRQKWITLFEKKYTPNGFQERLLKAEATFSSD